jgi:hypothetical protein
MDTTTPARPEPRPYDISVITDQLFIAAHPRARHVEYLRGLGVSLVLSTTWFAPPRELAAAFTLVRLPMIDFPLFPLPLRTLRRGVEAALPVLEAGRRVLVHCRQGRHRSVALACCVLIACGMTADEAMDLVIAKRPIADPHEWYIEPRIRAFERDWNERRTAPAHGPVTL